MSNTLPAPTEGLVYTNPTTGKRMQYSDGCWKSIDYLPLDASDSMQGTLWTPDQLINGNTLTADAQDLYFNGDPVMTDDGTTRSLATLLSTQSSKLGRTKYYQDSALPSGDSYDYPDGSLWYQPTSNKLNFYNDGDQTWVQL